MTIVAWPAWDDRRGRMIVLRIRGPLWWQINGDACRRLAAAFYGKDWVTAAEGFDGGCATYAHGLERDGAGAGRPLRPEGLVSPGWVRWFDARVLAAGIGQQDFGKISGRGRRMVPAD